MSSDGNSSKHAIHDKLESQVGQKLAVATQ